MSRQGDWHTIASLQEQIAELHVTTVEQAEHIEQLEAALAVKDGHDHFDCTADRAQCFLRIQQLEAELGRLRYFATVIEEHAENIKSEAAIALRPQNIKAGDE